MANCEKCGGSGICLPPETDDPEEISLAFERAIVKCPDCGGTGDSDLARLRKIEKAAVEARQILLDLLERKAPPELLESVVAMRDAERALREAVSK